MLCLHKHSRLCYLLVYIQVYVALSSFRIDIITTEVTEVTQDSVEDLLIR